MQIDSHQHFWKFTADEFPWIKPDWPIRQDYLPADSAPLLQHHGITRSVAVQARQSLEETRAGCCNWRKRTRGSPALSAGSIFVPITLKSRWMNLNRIANLSVCDTWCKMSPTMHSCCVPIFAAALPWSSFGLTYDILIFPCQLSAAIDLVSQFPEQKFVVDHLAKPPIAATIFSPWREQIEELAKLPNVFCKLSGFMTEADWQSWREADFNPYFDVVLAAFGAERLMFGSDWPVALLAGSYDQACSIVNHYIDKLSAPSALASWA